MVGPVSFFLERRARFGGDTSTATVAVSRFFARRAMGAAI
jgi:hypothetical protein